MDLNYWLNQSTQIVVFGIIHHVWEAPVLQNLVDLPRYIYVVYAV